MLSVKEAKRLLEHCLPALQQSLPSASSNNDDYLKRQQQLASSLISSSSDDEDTEIACDIQVHNMCRLWAGMGYVYQIQLDIDSSSLELIVKRVSPTGKKRQKISLGDQRKADSYECEANFYQNVAPMLLQKGLEIPIPLHVERDNGVIICMTQLQGESAYLESEETKAVLRWLATLHAATWGPMADKAVVEFGLQPEGTYWYLATRPDEHASIRSKGWEGRLKLGAKAIDERLKRDKMQCCVHGDAKDANMLFRRIKKNKNNNQEELVVAMYDFQYCGKAPPTKDLAYFLCVGADDNDSSYLEYYHEQLLERLDESSSSSYRPTLEDLQDSLDLAYCDWARFMAGWGYWGTDISKEVIRVLDRLDGGKNLGSEDAYREAVLREYG
mmetsp:Transcript_31862/g.77225  ORF Transcript_31862/g.77225 Transcript_31862/m.77225 type:complete len:386 (-) Transcript_31862:218-1375(-)